MQEYPTLVASKPLKSEFHDLREIHLTSDEFTIGRGLNNMVVIPFIAISRNHCKFQKHENDWLVEDNSTFGIVINGDKLGKGNKRVLKHEDIIELDQCQEFIYKFNYEESIFLPSSSKRIKLDVCQSNNDLLTNIKTKFEELQACKEKLIEDRIENTKQIKTIKCMLKEQLETNMKRKINILQSEFTCQVEDLKGEKDDVEKRTADLMKERDAQLSSLKIVMNEKFAELKEQIKEHNETETNLLVENNILKKTIGTERDDFYSELNRETSSKQVMLERVMVEIKEHKEIGHKEKKEFEKLLSIETKSLKTAKSEELNDLAKEKNQKELQLVTELNNMKKLLENQVESTEKQKNEALQQLNDQMEQMKKLKDEDNIKMEQLVYEREEMQKRLNEAQHYAESCIEELKTRVTEREVELAALAAERIQKQADQSSVVINSLQEQLERVRKKLQNVERENKKLLKHIPESHGEGSSKDTVAVFGEILETELQCSICAELFVSATTLNCSHTFCKYCITMWKKKKKECAICRTPITSECNSIVLDSFIEKMLSNMTEEMKLKRCDLLKSRNAVLSAEVKYEMDPEENIDTDRRSDTDDYEEDSDFLEEEDERDYEEQQFEFFVDDADTNSGSDWDPYDDDVID